MIAALFVDPKGSYAGLANVDLWPESRDARLYAGPHRVIAHPPCARWCRMAELVQAVHGHRVGDDGGCFASALDSVRIWGGILEHPAHSKAWPAHNLAAPPADGGWATADIYGGVTCCVEQGNYGHPARKATWLYAFGVGVHNLRWGKSPATAVCSKLRNHGSNNGKKRLSQKQASATPIEFRDALLSMVLSS